LAVLHRVTGRDVEVLRASATRGAKNTDGLNRYKLNALLIHLLILATAEEIQSLNIFNCKRVKPHI
jgi:hypothetical protein